MNETGIPAVETPDTVLAAEVIEEWFEKVALDDVRKVIEAKANYVAALALVSYTEVLGGLKRGKLGIQRNSEKNFNAGLALMSWNGDARYYRDFMVERDVVNPVAGETSELLGIYDVCRCGLVHQYFTQGLTCIHNNSSIDYCVAEDNGIGWHDGKLRFHTNAYYRDLKAAAARFREDVSGDSDQAALVVKAFRRLQSEAGVLRSNRK
jgi:hypothetical protein